MGEIFLDASRLGMTFFNRHLATLRPSTLRSGHLAVPNPSAKALDFHDHARRK